MIKQNYGNANSIHAADGPSSGQKGRFSLISGREVTPEDIREAVELDRLVYDEVYWVDAEQCEKWFAINPDIYVMVKDNDAGKIVAYVNVSPLESECFEMMRSGDFIDTGITENMILGYDKPGLYDVYFSSVVIHPDHRNSGVFRLMLSAVAEKFISLGERGVFVRRVVADAVTEHGEKFCRLLGMHKVRGSGHGSALYEVTMIPPKFRPVTKSRKRLRDLYQRKNDEMPGLFD